MRRVDRNRDRDRDRDRGQLVLVAAAVLAVALVPMGVAYLQLGYHDDVSAGADRHTPGENAVRLLERAVHQAAAESSGRPWAAREGAVAVAARSLREDVRTLETAQVDEGVVVEVAWNATAAAAWAHANCPGGPHRQFGSCVVVDGVVVQERAGETHLVAVGFDVRVTESDGVTDLTVVVRVVGGAE